MLSLVIDKCAEVLATQPDAVLPASSVGAKRPASGAELPMIALALTVDDTKGAGLSRFIRSGDVLAQHTGVVEVQASPATFDSSLRTLRIAPLPLKKSPGALSEDFSAEDIQIRNVTDLQHPIAYRLTERPAHKEEYRLDSAAAQIIFGAPQSAGDKLELVHWTITWRDDITGDRCRGTLRLEVWATGLAQGNELARKLQGRLRSSSELLRQKGFMKLEPAQLDPAENLLHAPPSGSAFPVWRQTLSYRFVFEGQEGGDLSDGGPIKRIDVDLTQPSETFSTP